MCDVEFGMRQRIKNKELVKIVVSTRVRNSNKYLTYIVRVKQSKQR